MRLVAATLTFLPFVLVGAGIGFAFGWPFGLVAAGLMLWLDDLIPDGERAGR